MKSRKAVAQYEATVVLVVVSLSLASVVYSGLRKESSLTPQPVFVSGETQVGGSPEIVRVEVNASMVTDVSSLSLDEASSDAGVIGFDGSAYSTSPTLCAAGKTTLFSVLAEQSGVLQVSTNGRAWVDGTWGGSVSVSPGWQEVMIQGGSSCAVTLPGGQTVPANWTPSSPIVSSIPAMGGTSGTSFVFYVPCDGSSHRLLITSSGGFDDVSI